MVTLIHTLHRIRRRLNIQRIINRAFLILLCGLALNLIFLLIDRVIYLGPFVHYLPVAVIAVSIAIPVILTLVRSPGLFEGAVRADERLGLKERLSSAYILRDRHTPAAEALHEDAATYAKVVSASKVVTLFLPRTSYYTFIVLIAFVLCSAYFPYFDLFNRKEVTIEQRQEQDAKKAMIENVRVLSERIKKQIAEEKDEKKIEALRPVVTELDKLARDLELDKIDRKDAAVQLSRLSDKIQERKNVMKSAMTSLQQLSRSPELKFTKELSKALSNLDSKAAQQEMKKLIDLIKSGQLSKEDLSRLKKELGQLAEGAQQLDPELAKKLQLAAKHLDGNYLLKAAGELELTEEDLLALGEAIGQMKMLDGVASDLEARKRAMLADASCLCQGGNRYTRDVIGPGMRGHGIGRGGEAPFEEGPVGFQDSKIDAEKGRGKIISQMLIKGQPLSGDSVEEYKQFYVESKQHSEDSLTKEVIPAGYRKCVREYFDSINPNTLKE